MHIVVCLTEDDVESAGFVFYCCFSYIDVGVIIVIVIITQNVIRKKSHNVNLIF